MIVHVIHNSTLLIVVQSRDLLAEWNIGQMEEEHLPGMWLVTSGAVLMITVALSHFFTRRR